ncbi:hypothetical protein QLH51_01895 [Sphingomonas sp. 2R-10]|uniref:hypothetical protein n=1 Tax=Sphingomonas sp. 2R-10 TaxID=3045148 RepID=UPI000F77EE7C|nr:hypothetical protein [Sphingomonas sp. 2R-10]MDJ0275559.1 hypothetical protein [Sphingomonas sp. 2R-10]
MPVLARYIEPDGTVIASNTPIELSGDGRLYRDADGVSIGSTGVYDRRTRTMVGAGLTPALSLLQSESICGGIKIGFAVPNADSPTSPGRTRLLRATGTAR